MKIAFAKIGKSIKFNSHYSPIGGDNEAPAVFKALANNNPDQTFYLIGRSDFATLSQSQRAEMFPYGNVFDCWEGVKFKTDEDKWEHINRYHDIIGGFDYAIIMFGQVGTVTIPGKIQQIKDRSLIASVIDMTKNYTTPISKWMNERQVPYIEIQNDPRYHCNQSRDVFHLPFKTLSQYNYKFTANHIKSYEDQDRVDTELSASYDGMETAFCIGRKYPLISEIEKTNSFMVVLNEGKPSRYDMLNEWVLSKFDHPVDIYGQWDDERMHAYAGYRGSKKLEELQPLLRNTKYTFIIPIAKGWVTSKYLEMIHNGVVPFFHPTYDEQNHTKVPDILRPKDPKDLRSRIKYLEKNPEQYISLLEQLQDILKPSYYDGTFLAKSVMGSIIDNYELPDLNDYSKVEVNTLEDFFG